MREDGSWFTDCVNSSPASEPCTDVLFAEVLSLVAALSFSAITNSWRSAVEVDAVSKVVAGVAVVAEKSRAEELEEDLAGSILDTTRRPKRECRLLRSSTSKEPVLKFFTCERYCGSSVTTLSALYVFSLPLLSRLQRNWHAFEVRDEK